MLLVSDSGKGVDVGRQEDCETYKYLCHSFPHTGVRECTVNLKCMRFRFTSLDCGALSHEILSGPRISKSS